MAPGLAATEARYRELVEGATDAIYTLDAFGVLTSANAALADLLGAPREQIIGLSLLPFLEPSDQARVQQELAAVARGARRRYECQVVRPDGTRRLVSVSLSPVTVGGAVDSILAVSRDVTEERAQLAALERAEARYTRLVESAEDGIATMDEEGNLTSVNRALERVVRRPRSEIIGTHFTELVQPDERAQMWRAFAATLRGERQLCEMRFTHADGRAGVAAVRTAPVFERGRVTAVLAFARDITEERALLGQLVRIEKLAALGELVGGVAHEINTPLTGILAFSQILVSRTEGPEARQAADVIAQEAKRAARIVGQLLTFARQNPPERLRTDLNAVVRESIELRRHPMTQQGITLDLRLDSRLPVTWADPFQLQQVFLNLLANAEQSLAEVGFERHIHVSTAREGDGVLVTVADSGRGIAPEHLPHIFNPFYTTKPRGIGTGLGLSISHGIVREHGGSLRVHCEPGCGAVFEVRLPIVSPSENILTKSPTGPV